MTRWLSDDPTDVVVRSPEQRRRASSDFADVVVRYSPDQPRDEAGRFGSGSGGAQSPRIHTQGGADGTDHGDPSKHPEIEELRKRILGNGGSKQEVVVVPGNTGPVWISAPHLKHITQQTRQLNKERAKHEEGTPEHDRLTARLTELREERTRLWREGVKEVREVQAARALTREEAHAEIAKLTRGDDPGEPLDYTLRGADLGYGEMKPPEALVRSVDRAMDFLGSVAADGALDTRDFKVTYKPGVRAYASGRSMTVSGDDPTEIICHEYGHIMEAQSVAHLKAAAEFLDRRCKDEIKKEPYGRPLNDIIGRKQYDATEKAWDDRFTNKYTGKAYIGRTISGGRRLEATEVTSMGLQQLYHNPRKFAEEDPDHFRFTIEQLRRKRS